MDYAEFKNEIEQRLSIFIDEKLAQATNYNTISLEIVHRIKDLVLAKGKRIRPWLVYVGASLSGKVSEETLEEIYTLGLALEVFHTFCLIHDDIMDKASVRRGVVTIHRFFEDEISNKKPYLDGKNLGIAAGILAGDLCLIYSGEILDSLKKNILNENFWKVYREMQIEVSLGQNDDTLGVGIADLDTLTQSEIIKMIDYKSGRYSIQKPLMLGSILNDGSQLIQQNLSKIGENLGVVFQLTDDILGVFGDSQVAGKSVSSDIEEGKRTLLIWKTYQKADEKEKSRLNQIFLQVDKTKEDVTWVKDLMEKYDILNFIKDFCDNLLGINDDLLASENFFDDLSLAWIRDFQAKIVGRSF